MFKDQRAQVWQIVLRQDVPLSTQIQSSKITDQAANGEAFGNDGVITDRQDVTEDEEEEDEDEYDDEEENSTGGAGGNESPATALVMS